MFVLLVARGFIVLAHAAAGPARDLGRTFAVERATAAALLLALALTVCAGAWFIPRQTVVLRGFTNMPQPPGPTLGPGVVTYTVAGRAPAVHNALVTMQSWWLYVAYFAPLDCPNLQQCDTVFATSSSVQDDRNLQAAFPGRTLYHVHVHNNVLTLQPALPGEAPVQ